MSIVSRPLRRTITIAIVLGEKLLIFVGFVLLLLGPAPRIFHGHAGLFAPGTAHADAPPPPSCGDSCSSCEAGCQGGCSEGCGCDCDGCGAGCE